MPAHHGKERAAVRQLTERLAASGWIAVAHVLWVASLSPIVPKAPRRLTPVPAEEPGDWTFDVVEMKDGRVHRGLVLAGGPAELEFAEIVRPPGKPMFAVIRPLAPDQVAKKQLLGGEQRAKLWARFQEFRNRARIEAGRMEDVTLRRTEGSGKAGWTYEGPWFQLDSTADEIMVRRCVVRAEQIFRAYRQTLPPSATIGPAWGC